MHIVDRVQQIATNNPAALRLFIKRANILLGTELDSAFELAGRIARDVSGDDRGPLTLLFRCCCDAGTSRARRKTGWQL